MQPRYKRHIPVSLVLILSSIGVAAHAPAAVASPAARCRPAHAKTLLRSQTILVVRRADGLKQSCYLPTRRVHALDVRPSDPRADHVDSAPLALNDRFVAYQVAISRSEGVLVQMRVLDARRDKVITRAPAYSGAERLSLHIAPVEPRRDVALRHDGSVAWLQRRPSPDLTRDLQLALPSRRVMTVASAADIVSGSLAINARFVYWRQSDGAHSFAIP
jgi:hypothetical protein